jgi:hypothetical protein
MEEKGFRCGFVAQQQYPTRLVLSEISGSHGGEHEDGSLLGCCAVYSGRSLPTFQR